jgi:tetratricopeptide (TPR) repeat protein
MRNLRKMLFFFTFIFFLSCAKKADNISLAYILTDDYLIYPSDSGYPSKIDEAKNNYLQALEFFNKKDYKKAVDNFIMACRDFTFKIVYYQLGLCLMNTDDYDNARKAFLKSLNLSIDEYTHDLYTYDDNNSPRELYFAYYNIACIESIQKNFILSYEYLSKAVFYGYPYSEYMKRDPDLRNLFNYEKGIFLKAIEEKINNKRYNDEKDFDYEIMEDGITVEVIGYRENPKSRPGAFDPPWQKGRTVTINGYHGIRKDIIIPPVIRNLPVTVINEKAFYNKNLTSVIIPSGVIYIGEGAFADNKISDVIIPPSVKNIHKIAFKGNQITDLHIPYGVTHIYAGAFMNNKLNTVIIPNSIIGIGYEVFMYNQLKNILIPPRVEYISGDAFMENPLSSVSISAKLQLPGLSSIINNGFEDYYYFKREAAGIYTYNNHKWSFR